MKLFITSRNGIEIINLDKVVYLKADGNYTDFYLADGKVRTHLSTLSVFADAIHLRYQSAEEPSTFARMGRSYLINVAYVSAVNLVNNKLVFDSDMVKPLAVTKAQLKSLRDFIHEFYRL
ncbi:MAG: LytTR family DNA-binding domain-containing protein [Prevotella sp.]|nr:LytTR family transcriptional regulator [Prevotella sp.]MDY5656222.1 LytTR family DNA-binding domain-containing protein [Prevotella sp.]